VGRLVEGPSRLDVGVECDRDDVDAARSELDVE
jgi:hypothetical protein